MVEIIRHIVDAQRGMEVMDVKDSHGRLAQFQCGVLPGHPNPEMFFEQCLAEFAAQESQLAAHIGKFQPKTSQ